MTNNYVHESLSKNESYMKQEVGAGDSYDIGFREIVILETKIQLYFVNGLVEDSIIVEVLDKLIEINDVEVNQEEVANIIKNRFVNTQVENVFKLDVVIDKLLAGLIVVFVDGKKFAFVIDVRHYPGRQPEEPDTERVIRGSRDGFTENIIENSALIRRRIRDRNLRNEVLSIGKRSKTDVCISYLNDVANDEMLATIRKKLKQINIDNLVMADKALTELFFDVKWNPFPILRYTERPDVAAHHILSGFIIIIVDTSPNVMIIPTTYFDHLEHAEEYRQMPMLGTFIRWVRIFAVFLSIYLLPIWLLFVLEPSLLPKELAFIGPEKLGNIPISIQILLAVTGVEFLRMAAIHTPTPLATALGLIAAVLIGDIAIQVGLFSPEVILYVAVSTVGFYVTPSYELSVANKVMNLFLIVVTILYGLNGLLIGITLSIIFLVRSKTLHTPYMWPLIPFHLPTMLRFIFRYPITIDKRRPRIVRPKDSIRQS